VRQKCYTTKVFGSISRSTRNFKLKFFTLIVCSYLRYNAKFFQLTLAFMTLCHIKRDHLVNLYIEKREHFWYLCNSKTNLHKSLHDDAKRVSSVPGVKIKLLASFQLFNNYTARWHLFCAKDIVFSHNRYIKKQKFSRMWCAYRVCY